MRRRGSATNRGLGQGTPRRPANPNQLVRAACAGLSSYDLPRPLFEIFVADLIDELQAKFLDAIITTRRTGGILIWDDVKLA